MCYANEMGLYGFRLDYEAKIGNETILVLFQ